MGQSEKVASGPRNAYLIQVSPEKRTRVKPVENEDDVPGSGKSGEEAVHANRGATLPVRRLIALCALLFISPAAYAQGKTTNHPQTPPGTEQDKPHRSRVVKWATL